MKIRIIYRDTVQFLESLEEPHRSKAMKMIDLLEESGPALRMPYSRALGGGLFELRVQGAQAVRFFYAFHYDSIAVLHGFVKKTAVIPLFELRNARRRFQDLTNNNI